MNFTKEQQQAIDTRDEQILVAAAAGSGKTAVLVQRILKLITEGTDIDKLLVATFTEAAAAEMKERIGDALAKLLEDKPDDENLLRQSARLPAASISTIHAFCLKLVKDHFHRIDLDPGFRIGDQAELNLLQSQVMETLFEISYTSNPAFPSLVEIFGGGKTRDIRLDQLIRRLFDFIESQPFPEAAVQKYTTLYDTSLESSQWIHIIKEEIALALDAAQDAVTRACQLCNLPGGPEKYLIALEADEAIIHNLQSLLQSDAGLDKLYDTFSQIKHAAIHTYRGKAKEEIDEDLRLQAKDLRDKDIKKRIEKIKSRFLFASPEKMRDDIHKLQPIVKSLFDLTLNYRTQYNAEKRARNLVDFSDLEHYAIQILWQGDFADQSSLTPSPVAQMLSAKFDEVLIDEYQDTNEVQERILSAIATNAGTSHVRRFMVGDVKQSIYGFRHAQPKLFTQRYDDPDTSTIVLSKNFRSRSAVLDTVNFFFYRLMSRAAGDIDYDNHAALYLGADFPEIANHDFTAELHMTDAADIQDENEAADDNEASEADASRVKIRQEAKLIAQRIHTLVGHMPVRDANAPTGTRPCRHSDIVVLTRSVRSIAATLTEELKLQGINAAAETSGGFFETPEIMIALSLLRVVDNPRQDIDLLALLRLYNFTPDEMLAIRFQSEDTDYYDCLLAYMDSGENTDLRNRINALLEDINRWRKRAIVLPISRLVGVLYEETRLPYRFGAMPGGTVRQANLQLLLEKAIQYEATSFTGLFHFVQYIEWLKTHAEDESAAMILPEDDTIVRVMTIHKSKGLEFPVVFVTMLGRQLNRMDERTGVILHPALGLGAMYTDLALRTRSNTISRLALSLLRQREMVSEELRVLYVAMTRAKEKLILTGCVTDLDGKLEKWQALSDSCGGSLPLYALREGKSYLDWLMPCALQSQEDVILHIHREMATEYTTPISLTELAPQMLAPSPNIIQYQAEPYKTESTLPSKLAISELKRIYALETSPDSATVFEDESIFEAPAFYKEATGQITPMHMGTILHTVVEHMDIHNDRDTAAITALIAALVDRGLLSQEEEDAVDISKIEGFATSQLADRMRNARYLYREIPFVIGIPPQAVYADMNIDDSATDDILVHGIIDCYFETQEGDIVLVDFKSDARPETLHQRYATQMKIYRKAIEQATGKPVSESLFYSFS